MRTVRLAHPGHPTQHLTLWSCQRAGLRVVSRGQRLTTRREGDVWSEWYHAERNAASEVCVLRRPCNLRQRRPARSCIREARARSERQGRAIWGPPTVSLANHRAQLRGSSETLLGEVPKSARMTGEDTYQPSPMSTSGSTTRGIRSTVSRPKRVPRNPPHHVISLPPPHHPYPHPHQRLEEVAIPNQRQSKHGEGKCGPGVLIRRTTPFSTRVVFARRRDAVHGFQRTDCWQRGFESESSADDEDQARRGSAARIRSTLKLDTLLYDIYSSFSSSPSPPSRSPFQRPNPLLDGLIYAAGVSYKPIGDDTVYCITSPRRRILASFPAALEATLGTGAGARDGAARTRLPGIPRHRHPRPNQPTAGGGDVSSRAFASAPSFPESRERGSCLQDEGA
uniref:Uncharacterized protein n=1 Tax=Mycena chlorophos TaxID=658473 RepID=A0ABQ0LMS8_MYCCL|nr:predicted protein [Mycena chlorophos]